MHHCQGHKKVTLQSKSVSLLKFYTLEASQFQLLFSQAFFCLPIFNLFTLKIALAFIENYEKTSKSLVDHHGLFGLTRGINCKHLNISIILALRFIWQNNFHSTTYQRDLILYWELKKLNLWALFVNFKDDIHSLVECKTGEREASVTGTRQKRVAKQLASEVYDNGFERLINFKFRSLSKRSSC